MKKTSAMPKGVKAITWVTECWRVEQGSWQVVVLGESVVLFVVFKRAFFKLRLSQKTLCESWARLLERMMESLVRTKPPLGGIQAKFGAGGHSLYNLTHTKHTKLARDSLFFSRKMIDTRFFFKTSLQFI